MLGLPAVAKVVFPDAQALQKSRQRISNKHIDFGERTSSIKYLEDAERLSLNNRRLMIQVEAGTSMPKTLVELSRFGRVMHLDWPIEASMNPTLQDVK